MKRLLPILLFVLLLFSGCDGTASGGTDRDGTAMLRGNFARHGGTVFFVANETLWRMGLDGSNRQKVADGCSSIADVTGREVFFLWRGEVTRVNWNGSARTVLADDAWGLAGITDTWLYYTDYDETSLVRISRDGQRKEAFQSLNTWPLLSDGKSVVFSKSGTVYYIEDGAAQPEKLFESGASQLIRWQETAIFVTKDGIVKLDLVDRSVTKLTNGPCWSIRTDGSRIFYRAGEGNLYSIKNDGTDPVQLTSDGLFNYASAFKGHECYTVENGWAYYLGKDKCLYRVSGDGMQTQRLTESAVYPVDVSGGQITYINSKINIDDDVILIDSEAIIRRMNVDGTGERIKDLTGRGLNTGTFLAVGDYLYLDRWTEIEQKLYRVRKDGQGREETGNQVSESIFGELRFFLKRDGKGIFCSNIDGSGEFQLCPQYGWDFAFEDGWLYFRNNDGIWRVHRDSPGEARLLVRSTGDVMEFAVTGGKVIYRVSSAEPGILSVDTNGTGLMRMVGGDSISMMGANGGWVYYSRGVHANNTYIVELRRIRPDGTGDGLVLAGNGGQIQHPALASGWIYYCNDKSPGRFRRVNCETGQVELVNKHSAFDIKTDGEYVYYVKDQAGVWRVPLAGGEAKPVVAESVNTYRLSGDWVYYQSAGRIEDIEVVPFR